ncbi:MAG TPA: UvrD-helicase domain-containing protein [Acidimicrobiia bacterium]|nr:UvrD-helicase domain-containing protein [Acidimicrobiia bacterium]
MTPPRDAAARARIRDALDVSLFVEAGAGTGKTSALVDRVVALVARGAAELRHVAAITFTEAAAAELRDRVRAALEAVANGFDEQFADDEARARCARGLHQLDDAALTTLHGFAQRILSDHPFELGLPPGFAVLEEIEASVVFEQRWAAFVDSLFADPAVEPALTVWLAGGLAVDRLRPVAEQLSRSYDRLPDRLPPPPSVRQPRVEEVLVALGDLVALRQRDCRDDRDLLAVHIDEVTAARTWLTDAADPLDALEALSAVPKLTCTRGRKTCWEDVNAARTACEAAEAVRRAAIDGPRGDALLVLVARVIAFVRDTADRRRREGRLEFHDLLVLARDLLRDHPLARRAVAARYQHLLLDEFQDTDPLQIEIAALLTADDPDPTTHWSELSPRAGRLTLVGDPKQSIYGFRRADLGVYDEARLHLGLESVALTENFRSVPPILDVVNTVFEQLLVESPGIQAAHVHLSPHRPPAPETRVVTVGAAHDALMTEVRESEAADVAGLVRQIVGQGWPIEDPRDGTVRPVQARDVALLIPSRTVLPALEAALEEADIPVRVESQSLVYSTAEVRDLLAVLGAIEDPTDEVAVVGSLRSPAFGCSDADLVAHVEAGGGWDYRRDPPGGRPDDDPVAAGLRSLHGYWQARWWRSVSEIVETVVREHRFLELAARHRRPRDHWRRIRFLLDQARGWEDAGQTSLRRFIEWAHRQAEEGARVNESVAPEPDDPALRILTVHGAKGLEFPVVILAGLNTIPSNRLPEVLWGAAGPEVRVGAANRDTLVQTAGYATAREADVLHDEAERLRLLYVAMTRARDHLVVSLHHRRGSKSHAALLAPHLEAVTHDVTVAWEPETPSPGSPARRVPASAEPGARDAWIQARAALVARAGAPVSIAATALAAETVAPGDEDGGDVEPRAPWQRGRAGTALGRAVHAVLQTVDLATGAGLDATARAQALAEGVAGREREVRNLAASVLASPVVRTAVAAGWDRWREVPVAADVDGILLEGFVDLLIRTPDGLIVVDYKTDRAPTGAELDAAVARYSPQAGAYALALEATLRERVTRGVFVFAREPDAIERDVLDLAASIDDVRRRLREPAPA